MSQFDSAVSNLLNRHGGLGTLKIITDGVYSDGEILGSTTVNYNVQIAIFDYPQASAGDKANFGTLILEGDKMCYMKPVSKDDCDTDEPVIKANRDLLQIGSTVWKILTVKEINPSGANPICYELHLRK